MNIINVFWSSFSPCAMLPALTQIRCACYGAFVKCVISTLRICICINIRMRIQGKVSPSLFLDPAVHNASVKCDRMRSQKIRRRPESCHDYHPQVSSHSLISHERLWRQPAPAASCVFIFCLLEMNHCKKKKKRRVMTETHGDINVWFVPVGERRWLRRSLCSISLCLSLPHLSLLLGTRLLMMDNSTVSPILI